MGYWAARFLASDALLLAVLWPDPDTGAFLLAVVVAGCGLLEVLAWLSAGV